MEKTLLKYEREEELKNIIKEIITDILLTIDENVTKESSCKKLKI